jgi:hypothetical protein
MYKEHISMLELFKEESQTQKANIVPKIQVRLYRNGQYVTVTSVSAMFNISHLSLHCRVNSGVQPLAAEQRPKLTTSAIQNAIQDWDDETESEFSDSRDIEEDE